MTEDSTRSLSSLVVKAELHLLPKDVYAAWRADRKRRLWREYLFRYGIGTIIALGVLAWLFFTKNHDGIQFWKVAVLAGVMLFLLEAALIFFLEKWADPAPRVLSRIYRQRLEEIREQVMGNRSRLYAFATCLEQEALREQAEDTAWTGRFAELLPAIRATNQTVATFEEAFLCISTRLSSLIFAIADADVDPRFERMVSIRLNDVREPLNALDTAVSRLPTPPFLVDSPEYRSLFLFDMHNVQKELQSFIIPVVPSSRRNTRPMQAAS